MTPYFSLFLPVSSEMCAVEVYAIVVMGGLQPTRAQGMRMRYLQLQLFWQTIRLVPEICLHGGYAVPISDHRRQRRSTKKKGGGKKQGIAQITYLVFPSLTSHPSDPGPDCSTLL